MEWREVQGQRGEREISIRAAQITEQNIKQEDGWQVTDPPVRWENISRSLKRRMNGG